MVQVFSKAFTLANQKRIANVFFQLSHSTISSFTPPCVDESGPTHIVAVEALAQALSAPQMANASGSSSNTIFFVSPGGSDSAGTPSALSLARQRLFLATQRRAAPFFPRRAFPIRHLHRNQYVARVVGISRLQAVVERFGTEPGGTDFRCRNLECGIGQSISERKLRRILSITYRDSIFISVLRRPA